MVDWLKDYSSEFSEFFSHNRCVTARTPINGPNIKKECRKSEGERRNYSPEWGKGLASDHNIAQRERDSILREHGQFFLVMGWFDDLHEHFPRAETWPSLAQFYQFSFLISSRYEVFFFGSESCIGEKLDRFSLIKHSYSMKCGTKVKREKLLSSNLGQELPPSRAQYASWLELTRVERLMKSCQLAFSRFESAF